MNLVYHSRPFRRLSRISISKAVKKSNTCMQKEIIYKINSVFNSESTYIPNLVFRPGLHAPFRSEKILYAIITSKAKPRLFKTFIFFFSEKFLNDNFKFPERDNWINVQRIILTLRRF